MEPPQLMNHSQSLENSMSNAERLVYVVDDDASAREGVAGLLRSAGMRTKTFASGEEFLASPPKAPGCVLLDLNLPGLSGLDVQQRLAESSVRVPVIFLTGHGDIPTTVRAVRAGAVNFLTKPFDDEELLHAIEHSAAGKEEANVEVDQDTPREYNFQDIVGRSNSLRKVLDKVAIVAGTDSTVLLHGETGTGKELVARAVHNLSSRKDRNLVRLNCAAIPSGLVESELFGHEKGAFTGALIQKHGRFELADHGTLFLDEVGDIGLDLQPKLLRALQEREFERLGSTRTIRVDVRLIAATHRDLGAMIREGKFREDLFYRLNVFPIEVPPLRERREDIPLLIHHFVARFARVMEKQVGTIPARAMDALTNAPWPGNIRELENFIERCMILTRGDQLFVPVEELAGPAATRSMSASTFHEAERRAIIDALRACSGKLAGRGGAAERLGLKRTTLQRKMSRLNISRSDHPCEPSGVGF
jgi:DNA-binding NtrC family response regulator